MKFIEQTKFGKEGNCLSANLASIFNIPLEEFPQLPDDSTWQSVLNKWLISRCRHYLLTVKAEDLTFQIPGIVLAAGPSERDLMHSVIYENGKMIHDPHPSKKGIERIVEYDLIISVLEEGCFLRSL